MVLLCGISLEQAEIHNQNPWVLGLMSRDICIVKDGISKSPKVGCPPEVVAYLWRSMILSKVARMPNLPHLGNSHGHKIFYLLYIITWILRKQKLSKKPCFGRSSVCSCFLETARRKRGRKHIQRSTPRQEYSGTWKGYFVNVVFNGY